MVLEADEDAVPLGVFDALPPMVDTSSKNYLKISLDEIAAGKIKYRYLG